MTRRCYQLTCFLLLLLLLPGCPGDSPEQGGDDPDATSEEPAGDLPTVRYYAMDG